MPVYEDPEISCWQARVLEPRQVPPALAGTPPDDTLGEGREAMLLLSDVYQGLEGVPRGSVKYLRRDGAGAAAVVGTPRVGATTPRRARWWP